jgi:hypothetical protein
MNNKFNIRVISLILTVFTLFGHSQVSDEICDIYQTEEIFREKADTMLKYKETESLTYDQAINNLQELYGKMQNSDLADKVQNSLADFKKKLKIKYITNERKEDFFQRISENINATSFKTIEEAIFEYTKYIELSCQHYVNSEEFWVYSYMAMEKFGMEIFSEAIMKYHYKKMGITETPPKFPDRELELDIKFFTPQPEEKP